MKSRERKAVGNPARTLPLRTALLIILSVFLGTATIDAQEKKPTRQEREDAWRAERMRKRRAEEMAELRNDSIEYIQAIQSLRNGSWALEASSVTFDNGVTHYVTPSTNYVSANNGTAVIQTAFDNSNIYSPNGLGGITVEGNITGEELKVDNEGNLYYSYNIQGAQVSATVNIVVTANSNQATARVDPNFSIRDMTLSGSIYPYRNAGIIEGTTGY